MRGASPQLGRHVPLTVRRMLLPLQSCGGHQLRAGYAEACRRASVRIRGGPAVRVSLRAGSGGCPVPGLHGDGGFFVEGGGALLAAEPAHAVDWLVAIPARAFRRQAAAREPGRGRRARWRCWFWSSFGPRWRLAGNPGLCSGGLVLFLQMVRCGVHGFPSWQGLCAAWYGKLTIPEARAVEQSQADLIANNGLGRRRRTGSAGMPRCGR
jgi:hypothetical protein